MMAWKIRCCLAKRRKETDMDWIEIRDMLGLEITPDQLRKQAVGYEEYDDYIHGFNWIIHYLKNTKMLTFFKSMGM